MPSAVLVHEHGDEQSEVSNECEDSSITCYGWKVAGYCNSRVGWMLKNCPSMCNKCQMYNMKCIDKNTSCLVRKELGQCETNSIEMNKHCPQSCGVCQVPREIQVNWVSCKEACGGEGPCDKCGYRGRCCSGATGKEGNV